MAKKDIRKVDVDGETYRVDMAAVEDLDTLDMLGELQDGNPFVVKKLLVAIFGKEQFEAIAERLRKDGHVSAADAAEFLAAVLKGLDSKN